MVFHWFLLQFGSSFGFSFSNLRATLYATLYFFLYLRSFLVVCVRKLLLASLLSLHPSLSNLSFFYNSCFFLMDSVVVVAPITLSSIQQSPFFFFERTRQEVLSKKPLVRCTHTKEVEGFLSAKEKVWQRCAVVHQGMPVAMQCRQRAVGCRSLAATLREMTAAPTTCLPSAHQSRWRLRRHRGAPRTTTAAVPPTCRWPSLVLRRLPLLRRPRRWCRQAAPSSRAAPSPALCRCGPPSHRHGSDVVDSRLSSRSRLSRCSWRVLFGGSTSSTSASTPPALAPTRSLSSAKLSPPL